MAKNCYIQPYTKFNSPSEWENLFKYLAEVKNTQAVHVKTNTLSGDPAKFAYFVGSKVDEPNGFVDLEFVVVGYGKDQINVEYSVKESTLFVRNLQNESLCSYYLGDKLTQQIDFSQNITSTLKNGLLNVAFKLKQTQKDIKIKID